MKGAAYFSADGAMRWELTRHWTDKPPSTRRVCVFLMMNPSTAGATENDPTILRCVAFAKYWGYDGIRVVNLVGFRATKPKDMFRWFKDQTRLDLRVHMQHAYQGRMREDVAKIVVAHGKLPKFMQVYAYYVTSSIMTRRNLHAIKLNIDGSPAHPLYLDGKLTPTLYFPKMPC